MDSTKSPREDSPWASEAPHCFRDTAESSTKRVGRAFGAQRVKRTPDAKVEKWVWLEVEKEKGRTSQCL